MIARMVSLSILIALMCGCGESTPSAAVIGNPSDNNASAPTSANGNGGTPEEAEDSVAATDGGESPVDGNSNPLEKDGITAEIASWAEVQEFVKEQEGKVVVLDAWSTYCAPCLREFPNLVALQQKYPERVVCISFNLNYAGIKDEPPEAAAEEILAELVKQKSTLKNMISSTADEKFYEAVDLASIPAVFVYGPDGKLAQCFDNDTEEYGKEGFTYEKHIIPLIEGLLPAE